MSITTQKKITYKARYHLKIRTITFKIQSTLIETALIKMTIK